MPRPPQIGAPDFGSAKPNRPRETAIRTGPTYRRPIRLCRPSLPPPHRAEFRADLLHEKSPLFSRFRFSALILISAKATFLPFLDLPARWQSAPSRGRVACSSYAKRRIIRLEVCACLLLPIPSPRRISLKTHPEYSEKWVEDRIAEDPSILRAGRCCPSGSPTPAAWSWSPRSASPRP